MKSQKRDGLCAAACGALLLACGVVLAPALAQDFGRGPTPEQLSAAQKVKTPMLNGKPDLTGFWGNVTEYASAAVTKSADGKKVEFQIQPPFAPRAGGAGGGRRGGGGAPIATAFGANSEARPPYKAELLAKVEQLRVTDVDTDPSFVCNPSGVPRAGIPSEIFQSKDAVVLIYSGDNGGFRVIPTDGRKFDDTLDPSWNGDSVGHWEGATLVINAVNFTDESWLAGGGWFHSDQMKVTERITREGNTLRWEARVEDPEVLQHPWIMPPRTVMLGKAGAHVMENAPCHERDQAHMVDKYHITP